ncbi:MAG: hypothetical protein II169_04665 [Lachnospiraceae bacterium]|nr:hypothetical protein [Lachnospiraceae bacterium]
MKLLKRLNDALPSLVVTIIIYGIIVELIGVWFAESKVLFTTGLWIGELCAIFMAIHIAIIIRDAVSLGESSAKRMAAKSVLRYVVVVIVFLGMTYFRLGSFVAAFIGVLGLKVCAYAQPFIHTRILKDVDKSAEEGGE